MLQNGDRQRIGLLGFRLALVTLAWVMPLTLFAAAGFAADPPLVEQYLQSGKLAEGHDALTAHLKDHPDDQQARLGLGVLEFLQSIEHLAQSHYKYGLLRDVSRNIPLLRLPVPENADPQTLSYDGLREVLKTFVADLSAAEKTLTGIGDAAVELPLHFGLIRLDLDGDGAASDEETLWKVYAAVSAGTVRNVTPEDAEKFVIQFDTGDAYWLRGYCHLLMFFSESSLAYDGKELFERTGHLLWPKTETPYAFLQNGKKVFAFGGDVDVADVIALIHLINFPVKEPERMTAAHGHLQAMIELSRLSWKAILAEKDDEAEWVPNPRQTGVIPGVRITKDMVDAWHLFLTEMDQILDGKKLIPFWRGGDRGINFKKVFTEPRNFDLVLWIQGTDAAPYLEEGEVTSPEVWQRLMRVFQGEFIGFAIWFN